MQQHNFCLCESIISMHTAAMRVAFLQSLFQQSWYNYCSFQRAIVQGIVQTLVFAAALVPALPC